MKAKIQIIFLIILFLLSLGWVGRVLSQQVQQEWIARFIKSGTEYLGPSLQVDRYGNSYVLGNTWINDSSNLLIIKYNSSGIQLWVTTYKYPGDGYATPVAMALDSSGNPVVSSMTGLNLLAALNSLTVKLNSGNGTVLWAKKYTGQTGQSQPNDIQTDNFNNVYVAGFADSSLLCIKYNPNGDTTWVRKYHPIGIQTTGNACTIDDSTNIIITGSKSTLYSDTLLIVKYNLLGTFQWAKTYFNPSFPRVAIGTKILNDQNGNIYIGGITYNNYNSTISLTMKCDGNGIKQWMSLYYGKSTADNRINKLGIDKTHNTVFITGFARDSIFSKGNDFFTIKFNANNGDSIWIERYNGPSQNNSEAKDIKIDTAGNVYVTGSSLIQGVNDFVTIKYLASGDTVWTIKYEDFYGHSSNSFGLCLDQNNNVYVMGTSTEDGTTPEYIVIKYDQLIGVKKISSNIPMNFQLFQNYPNPFNPSSIIKFSIPKKSFVNIKVFDMLGRLKEKLVDKELSSGEYEITFNGLNYSSGVYFYQLTADNNIIDTKKLVILK